MPDERQSRDIADAQATLRALVEKAREKERERAAISSEPMKHVTEATVAGERGEAIYRERYAAEHEEKHHGWFCAIDVDSGDAEFSQYEDEAVSRLHERRPGCFSYLLRIGYVAVHTIGASNTPLDRRPECHQQECGK